MLSLARSRGATMLRGGGGGMTACVRRYVSSGGATPLASLKNRASAAFDDLMNAEWVDENEAALIGDKVDSMMEEYRPLYNADAVNDGGEDKQTYEAVRSAYVASEAAKLVDLYADHMTVLMRKHMDMTGSLGNDTKLDSSDAQKVSETLREYVLFLNAIEIPRVRRKAESQLGRKVVVLRQVLSVDQFSGDFHPIACDHMVTTTRRRVAPVPPQPRATS